MTENPNILKRLNDHYHIIENDEFVKSIFNSGKNMKQLGMQIPEWMLTEEMKLTRYYKLYASKFGVDILTTKSQPIESTQGTHGTPSTPRPPNPNIKKVQEHLVDEEIKKIVEGNDDVDENQFFDDTLNSQEDPSTRTDYELKEPRFELDDSKMGQIPLVRLELELRGFKTWLLLLITTLGDSWDLLDHRCCVGRSRDDMGEAVHATLKNVVPPMIKKTTNDIVKKNMPKVVANAIRLERQKVDSNLRNYMSNHILHVHPTASASFSIPDLQHQLYLRMKDDEQAHNVDLELCLSLKIKFEKPVPLVEPCRVAVVHTLDHEDHHDDDARPEGEISNQEQLVDFDAWQDDQGIDDDDVPFEEVSPELLDEVSGKLMTTDDLQ
ncbi:hypothetical protein Tco_0469543 [Tanacetum coccineum]